MSIGRSHSDIMNILLSSDIKLVVMKKYKHKNNRLHDINRLVVQNN
jgi:hypothetical protein